MDKNKRYRKKHSIDLGELAAKNKPKRRSLKKNILITAEGDQKHCENKELPQRVFLYLQPKSISYPSENIPAGRVEIELEHTKNKITTLSDHYMPRNIIQAEQFNIDRPTFSVTIKQDSVEDITSLSNAPIVLTLYVITLQKPKSSDIISFSKKRGEVEKETDQEKLLIEERIPVAQGYIDVIEYFNRKRFRGSDIIYLYPIETSAYALTCKTEWEIYSLHPLLRNTVLSNVAFITLGSLYNIKNSLMDDCDDLVAKLSFISKIPNENNEYEKTVICKFTAFEKCVISEQNLSKRWENLKNRKLNNLHSIGILSKTKFSLNKLFLNVLSTENVDFHFDNININEDYALICNSIHRYILTNIMEKTLEEVLSHDQYQMILEIYSDRDENKILLQGFIDLSIFMYPEVRYCSYAIELKPLGHKPHTLSESQATPKSGKGKKKGKRSFDLEEQVITEDKIPFAILQICLNKPISSPTQDMTEFSIDDLKLDKYGQCSMAQNTNTAKITLKTICTNNYRAFDDLVREILDYTMRNNIKAIGDDQEYFSLQLANITNRIMNLVACDFNVRFPTKSNYEFTNLMSTVYRELVNRISESTKECSRDGIENCVNSTKNDQNTISQAKNKKCIIIEEISARMSMAKYMYEAGNLEMANFFMDEIREKYSKNPMLDFYNFLYDMERQHFQQAKEYLEKSLDDKDIDVELFTDLIHIYLNYKLELQYPEQAEIAEENLISSLTEYCTHCYPNSLTGWIVLYCLYKKHKYQPGMAFTRWQYENRYDSKFFNLEVIPKSRWEIYMPYNIKLKSVKGQNYIKVMEQLLRVGLYEFAEWVFNEISNECLGEEKYCMINTFKIFSNNFDKNCVTKDFSVEKHKNHLQLSATLFQVNGNIEYFRNPLSDESMKYYNAIIDIKELDMHHYYQLGILRFAYRMMKEKQYEKAGKAFLYCCDEQINCIASAIGRAEACYYLGHLEEAEKYFVLSTKYEVFMPNTWAYLALINLKRGQNYNALECWKYARLNPEYKIHEKILNELAKIDPRDIFLYVDIPNSL